MSEKEIINLRKEIRQDMKDYKLLHYISHNFPQGYTKNFIFKDCIDCWFYYYLRDQITNNVKKLRQLKEGNLKWK